MNSYQAKQIPIQEALAKLGYLPVRKDKGGVEWVYNSPFRNEKEPSLFVNVRKNVWNDFGDIGGNLLDFVMRHESTDFRGALSFLDRLYSKNDFKAYTAPKIKKSTSSIQEKETFILDAVLPLKSKILENYLGSRSINISIARNYLKTVQFHHAETGKKYFGLGLENQSGDYEVRNEHLKTVVGKKDISLINGKGGVGASKQVAVFESAMDFLSYLSDKNQTKLESDVIILNSTQLTDRAKTLIEQKGYQKVYTFLDNDKAGDKATEILSELKNQIVSCNHIYQNFKDYNDYWQNQKVNSIEK
jgi:DNA primase